MTVLDQGVPPPTDATDLEGVSAVELGDVGGGTAGHGVGWIPGGCASVPRRSAGLFVLGHDGMIGTGGLVDSWTRGQGASSY
jgi:hypothetical protein